jgi:hypothetical protein
MNRKELENLIREILQQEQWKVVGGSRRYTPSRIEKWKKLVAAEPFPDADGDGVDDRDETTDDEEEYARRMAARDALKAKYLEEELPDDEKKIRDGLISYYREMYGQYGDDSFPEPDVLYGLSIEEIEELIDDLEEAEVAFELEYEKKRKS